ncbi:MAG TPA: MFS transporter, partial [Clostridia bacterium]|nr:MFS transporter [Clostridia bacterium]
IIIGYLLFFVFGSILPGRAPVPVQLAMLCVEAFIIGFGQTLFYMITTINMANTIEYNEYKTGSRDEAIIFSLRPFMAKLGSALQQVIITVTYILIGMIAITNSISEIENNSAMDIIDESTKASQIADVLNKASPNMAVWLRVCMVVLPIALFLASFFVMRYKVKIDEKTYENMLNKIEARRIETPEE